MAHFNNFGCYLIEVNLDDQSLFRLVLALASGILLHWAYWRLSDSTNCTRLMHFKSHLHFVGCFASGSRTKPCLYKSHLLDLRVPSVIVMWKNSTIVQNRYVRLQVMVKWSVFNSVSRGVVRVYIGRSLRDRSEYYLGHVAPCSYMLVVM